MSLINDALRRARQHDTETVAPPMAGPVPQGPPPLQPVDVAPASPWLPLLGLSLGLVAVVGLLGLGGWFAWKAVSSSKKPTLTASAKEAHPLKGTSSTVAPGASKTPVTVANNGGASQPSASTATAPSSPVPSNATAQVSAPPAAFVAPPVRQAAVKWPALKLQGIYYRPPKSSVMINNKTLYLDEEIQGVRVVEIGPQLARLTLGGQTNTLHLR